MHAALLVQLAQVVGDVARISQGFTEGQRTLLHAARQSVAAPSSAAICGDTGSQNPNPKPALTQL
jgi:hypothetical protein